MRNMLTKLHLTNKDHRELKLLLINVESMSLEIEIWNNVMPQNL